MISRQVVTIQQLGQRCTPWPQDRACGREEEVSETYRPPVHSSIHQLNGPRRLAVAYFRRDVNYLGGCISLGIALALGLVHSREAQSAERITTLSFCEGQRRRCPWTGNAGYLWLSTFPCLLDAWK